MPTENEARQALQRLLDDYYGLTRDQIAQMTEASVVRQFIDRLLRDVLGWPIEDPARYKYELATQAGRPDITLIPEAGGTIFVEAKRFGAIKELKEARRTIAGVITPGQMALPGMAVDRTEEEQQAINYAFANGGTWAILTNFEKLRLFNARRDWLVLSFETPAAYLDEFEQLWPLAYHNILQGSLDRLSNQRYTRDVDTQYLDFINEWREKLAQDIVQRGELNPWAFHQDGGINLPVLRAIVQRYLDRLVIVRFAEDHLVIPPGTLRDFYELRRGNLYSPSMDQFLDRFFRRFDEEHNSALFAEGLADHASFSDVVLLPLIGKLYEARYRSMPADIIGNTYEQYLGKTLALDNGSVTTRDNLETRKKQGSYYTPQVIVRHLVDTTLGRTLYGTANGLPDGEPVESERRKTSREIRDLRVLDSACGSGSFLIYAYYVLADFYESEIRRLQAEMEARNQELAAQGVSPMERRLELADYTVELERIRDYPRLILETHLYGVDLDPQAAEIAVVNLIMRAMERRQHEKRLPMILGQNIKVGNSLVGLRPGDQRLGDCRAEIAELIRLRRLLHTDPDRGQRRVEQPMDGYRGMTLEEANAIPNPAARERAIQEVLRRITQPFAVPEGTGHPTYDQMSAQTRALADRFDAAFAPHFSDLGRAHPFHWAIEFPEAFFDADGAPLDNPGFTIVIGNPPWEILKPDLREFYAQFDPDIESKLNRRQVERRIEELQAEDPRRAEQWAATTRTIEETAAYVRACGDYTRQGRGDTATHKLFLERMYGLLQDGGRIGYVVPSGIYTDLGTKDLREMLLDEGNIQYIYSFSNERFFFPGVDHRFKFALLGAQKGSQSDGFWAAFRFNPRVAVAPDNLPAFLADPANLIYMRRKSLEHFSPDSLSLMEFQTRRDYEVAERIYDDWPLLGEQPHPKSLSAGGEGLESAPDSLSSSPETGLLTRQLSPSPSTERGSGGEVAVGGAAGDRWFSKSGLWQKLKPLARQKRDEPTPAEELLWEYLHNRQVRGLKFRRQHVIERFVVDFYCAEAKLIIEVDGPIHDYTPDEDAIRQQFLESQGFRVLRFSNDEVLSDPQRVIARIAGEQPHPKSLSAGGEGLESAPDSLSSSPETGLLTRQLSPSPSTERGSGGEVVLWTVKFTNEFHMTNDRHLFNTAGRGLPLYEGKMIHQFDAFYSQPQFWVEEARGAERLENKTGNAYLRPRLAFRDIAAATNERTLISAVLPPRVFCNNKTPLVNVLDSSEYETTVLYLSGLFNSFALDFVIRHKVSTTLNFFYMETLPIPRLTPGNPYFDAIVPCAARLTCTRAEFADLWQQVMGSAWDELCGATDPAERQRLRDEIDALVAHLYGLSRADFDHILGTFPLVFPNTDEGWRKREALLAEYDRWAGRLG